MKYKLFFIFLSWFLSNCSIASVIFQTRARFHPVVAQHHMVSAQEQKAAEVGHSILAHGGNAIDAAVAVGFTLAVTLPRAGNLGGGGFLMYWDNAKQKATAVDYRETAPEKANVKLYLNERGDPIQDKISWHYLSSGVPGTVKGLLAAHEKWGRLPRSALLQPAIHLAEHGFKVTPGLADAIWFNKDRLAKDPETKKIFFKQDGQPYQMGDWFRQPELAHSLKLIAQHGAAAFYQGEIAEKIAAAMKKNSGLISLKDLKNYQVKFRKPVKGEYQGKIIYSMPPASSGGVTLIEMLNLLKEISIDRHTANTADYFHLLAEVMNLAYNDRNAELGDPDFVSVPVKTLLSQKHAQQLVKMVNPQKHTPAIEIAKVFSLPQESPQTTHFSIIDREGNMVANTYTLNYSFGNGHVIPGTGFLMNNELDDFTLKPGVPNAFGLVQGKKNILQANKRPLSSMTPTLVVNADKTPLMALGAPGGSQIITAVLQVLLNVLDQQMNIASAVSVPRMHSQLWPDKIFLEPGISQDSQTLLTQKGHEVATAPAIGSVQIVMRRNDKVFGFADTRRMGAHAVGQ